MYQYHSGRVSALQEAASLFLTSLLLDSLTRNSDICPSYISVLLGAVHKAGGKIVVCGSWKFIFISCCLKDLKIALFAGTVGSWPDDVLRWQRNCTSK